MNNLFRAAVAGYQRFLEENVDYTDRRGEFIDRTNEDDPAVRNEFMQRRIRYRLRFLDFMEAQAEIISYLKTLPDREIKFTDDDKLPHTYIFALNDQDQLIIQQSVSAIQ